MCSLRYFSVTLFLLILLNSEIYCKRNKMKRPQEDQEASTSQPDIVTYSSFGYNDVGGENYDGFVPSSPDYASYLSNYQETTTRIYAPAFPTALDNVGPEGFSNFEQQPQEGHNYSPMEGSMQFQQGSFNLVNPPSFAEASNLQYNDDGEESAPVYGTKLGSRNKNQMLGQYNGSKNVFESMPPTSYSENSSPYQNQSPQVSEQEPSAPSYESDNKKYPNIYNYAPTYSPTNYNSDFEHKPNSGISFPKVVDFTKYKMQYPTELDHKYAPGSNKPSDMYTSKNPYNNDDDMSNAYQQHNPETETMNYRYKETDYGNEEKAHKKPVHYGFQDSLNNQLEYTNSKYNYKNSESDYKDKMKSKLPSTKNKNNELASWNFSFKDGNTNYNLSNFASFQANNRPSTQSMSGDYETASNNVVDFTNYRFPKTSYTYFKDHNFRDEMPGLTSFEQSNENDWKNAETRNKNYFQEYQKQKNVATTMPSTTSYWGNSYKSYSTPPTVKHFRKPQYNENENDDVVHIPKKSPIKYSKYQETKGVPDWKFKPGIFKFGAKPIDEWNKEVSNRFKSEEDLLGLRTRDTSHPNYLPSFKLNNENDDIPKYASNYDYKTSIEKWRQSYLKSKKYKNWKNYDPEGVGSESQAVHVPIPKPYPVEIPHPVIVPVPQPYPVRVPIPKPVAIPVVRELRVPVEKPVPYPVYKKVPYPVEKPVPVPIEKAVAVPVEKPYPVPIPHVRPVFHHSRPSRDEAEAMGEPEMDFEDEIYSRPRKPDSRGTNRIVLRPKKLKSSRSRRPQTSYHERSRRRWPPRRPTSAPSQYRSRPPTRHNTRYRDYDPEQMDHEHSDFYDYCRRNGNC